MIVPGFVKLLRHATLVTITAVLFLLPAACGPHPVPLSPSVRARALPEVTAAAVVLVQLHEPDMPPYPANVYESCGGVAIGPRTILTAAHCVVQDSVIADTVLFRTRDQHRAGTGLSAATPRYVDEDRDVALLRTVEHVFAEYAAVRRATPADMTVELVRRFHLTVADSPMMGMLATPIVKGDSGSPVFGLDGAVIGIIRGCFFKPFVSSACVPELGGVYTQVLL